MNKTWILVLLLASACSSVRQTATTVTGSQTVADGKLFASVFQQRAAEYRALCFQAYNLAALRLDQYLLSSTAGKKAIITDIDETVLDNSPYQVHQALQGKDYDSTTWYEWSSRVEADTVPGAPAFLKYAASRGVEVFYITNRNENERKFTLQNLSKFGLPNADQDHLFPKQSTSGKEPRRQKVMADHEVLLLLCDNLADFSPMFDKKTEEERKANSTLLASEFGNRFIVLPNPGYGDWESSLYQYHYNLTPQQKDSIIRSVLRNY